MSRIVRDAVWAARKAPLLSILSITTIAFSLFAFALFGLVALNIKKALPKGTPVSITIPTDKEQTLTFQCGMGMYKSSVVVALN